METSIRDAGVIYIEKCNYAVFPLHGKIPFGKTNPNDPNEKGGFYTAVKTVPEWDALLKKHPNATGIGIATGKVSNVWFLDKDIKPNPETGEPAGGDVSLEALEAKHGKLPEGPLALTPSKGSHYGFTYPPEGIGSNAGLIGKGLDHRGDGGYIAAWPTPGYYWEVAPWEFVTPDAPQWLLDLARKKKQAPDLTKDGDKITSDRNQTLTKIAGSLRRSGLEAEMLYTALSGINAKRCTPPLDEQEIRKIATSVARYPPSLPQGAYTDHWAAELFKAKYGNDLHWCDALGGWQIWDGTRWLMDDTLKIERMAYDVIKQMHDQAISSDDKKLRKFAIERERDSQFRTMISRLRALEGIPASSGDFDQDTHKLNALNTTLDLKSGLMYAHHRPDHITRRIEVIYNPDAKCPRWMKFLEEIFSGDMDLIDYVQRAVGYSLSGDVSEHCMFVLYGMGRNGKSTFLKTLGKIMGDYAQAASANLLIERTNEGIRNDVAALRGVRMIVVQSPSAETHSMRVWLKRSPEEIESVPGSSIKSTSNSILRSRSGSPPTTSRT